MPRVNFRKSIIGDRNNNDLKTPDFLLQDLEKEFGAFFDPCPYGGIQGALENPELDGLKRDWQKVNFVNPPYKEIKFWLKKGAEEYKKGNKNIFLITARVSSKYWAKYVIPYASEIRFFIGSIVFDSPHKEYATGLPIPLCLIIFDPEKKHPTLSIKNDKPYNYWSF